jgi:hypothetical protein
MRKIFLLFLGVFAASIASWAQSDARPKILVLGTYHMGNPGHDIHNMQADDVLSGKRQQEIAQLIEVLKKFHPTKVAIEADVGSNLRTTGFSSSMGLVTSDGCGRTSRTTRPSSYGNWPT